MESEPERGPAAGVSLGAAYGGGTIVQWSFGTLSLSGLHPAGRSCDILLYLTNCLKTGIVGSRDFRFVKRERDF